MEFAVILKNFRRGVHVYGRNWNMAVMAPTTYIADLALKEAALTMEASSLGVVSVERISRRIVVETGARIQFHLVNGPLDAYLLTGLEYTQIAWLNYEHSEPMYATSVRPLLRSSEVPDSKLLWQPGVVLG